MTAKESTLPLRWWETVSAMSRPHLKAGGFTLRDLINNLDADKARGIDALEVFAPYQGGMNYHGLDALDFYKIDPEIGDMADFLELIDAAHQRGMAVIAFMNLGYGHENFPDFLKACDDVRNGIDSPETRYFLWSDTGQEIMDRSLDPYFKNDLDGGWRWNERAGKYFWVKWFGEDGKSELPQFNFGDPGWQAETQRIVHFWMQTGVDGMVIDAVNWYVDCNWDICRETMTDVIREYPNQFSQPEGAGGFSDDPVPWVAQGGFNCIMDYSIKLWWENEDTVGDAIRSGDPRPIEAALRGYRDRVVAAGGVCYIDPPNTGELPETAQILGAATVATVGELMIFIEDQLDQGSSDYWQAVTQLLNARREYPALCAGGLRVQVPTQDDSKFYAFLRTLEGERTMLVLLNFQADAAEITIDLSKMGFQTGCAIWGGDPIALGATPVTFSLPSFGYSILEID